MKILIIFNPYKEDCIADTRQIIDILKRRGFAPVMLERQQCVLFGCECMPLANVRECRFAIVLGGDGLLLTAARILFPDNIPILGVNHGRLGFLSELNAHNYAELDDILSGNYVEDKRMCLSVTASLCGMHNNFVAVNDVTIHRGSSGRLIKFDIALRGSLINSYMADGIIVSTPTGSTAYSLSAGGPIADPSLNTQIITPICPHALYARSIIVPGEMPLTISITHSDNPLLTMDGQEMYKLCAGEEITVVGGGNVTFMRKPDYNFYNKVHKKLFQHNERD